jgi:xanthine dehydrogenase small subunit
VPADSIRFVLDGEIIELHDVDPTRTVLQFLREDLRRTGSKEGCAEGDCGACTVVLAEPAGDGVQLRSINSCIQFLATLDGKQLITVESLQGSGGELHPVQRAMLEEHGSQCGFCTPGFVMSLYALYESNKSPSRREIDDALAGNLCRCTGYRPIIAAARSMYSQPQNGPHIVHPELLQDVQRQGAYAVRQGDRAFYSPVTSAQLAELLQRHPDATILAGGTDVGLWVTKQHREFDTVIYTGRVAALRQTATTATHLEIGAAVTLAEAAPMIVEQYPGLAELFARFASPPIRNAATLGGNIANGSPIGDSMPALMALGTTLRLTSASGQREIALQDFYHDYQVNDLGEGEFIETVCIPLAEADVIVRSYKWSKRFDQDISAVCTAYRLQLEDGKVTSLRIACGGMAAVIKRAQHCEAAITGQPWTQETIDKGSAALARDFTPISDMRASAEARATVCGNLLQRFYLEVSGAETESVYTYER